MTNRYFFPPESSDDNLCFTKFPLKLAYLAVTYHNVFRDIFSPATGPEYKDTFRFYPAMMIFRHSIELLLKAIINDVCKESPPTDTHDLCGLFKVVQAKDSVRTSLGSEEQFVTEAISELQKADKKSDGFRFGFDTKGQPYFQGMPKTVDGKRLFGICEQLWNTLWNVHGPVG